MDMTTLMQYNQLASHIRELERELDDVKKNLIANSVLVIVPDRVSEKLATLIKRTYLEEFEATLATAKERFAAL